MVVDLTETSYRDIPHNAPHGATTFPYLGMYEARKPS